MLSLPAIKRRAIKPAHSGEGKIADASHGMLTRGGAKTPLTGYALLAMVHCNIFLLQCTIPMSFSQSIREE
ncbi:hypothetical protein CK218_08535 [Mesorhizobium sp. WSM3879]|nr:hypothetical protein CK218_08535 [Mesorhizobium sp. WSM3879]